MKDKLFIAKMFEDDIAKFDSLKVNYGFKSRTEFIMYLLSLLSPLEDNLDKKRKDLQNKLNLQNKELEKIKREIGDIENLEKTIKASNENAVIKNKELLEMIKDTIRMRRFKSDEEKHNFLMELCLKQRVDFKLVSNYIGYVTPQSLKSLEDK
jgi:predicted transcriptional regulator